MWVIAWNEYATQNYLEPDKGLGPDAVEENMVWKTAHYVERLQAGEKFGYYEPLSSSQGWSIYLLSGGFVRR